MFKVLIAAGLRSFEFKFLKMVITFETFGVMRSWIADFAKQPGCLLQGRGIEVRFPVGARDFFP
jgi:hypothetical protein